MGIGGSSSRNMITMTESWLSEGTATSGDNDGAAASLTHLELDRIRGLLQWDDDDDDEEDEGAPGWNSDNSDFTGSKLSNSSSDYS